jgi:AGCS family alanine or glycine:cation symporter
MECWGIDRAIFWNPSIVTGVILAVIVGAVIIGGIKRIGEVTSKLVPFHVNSLCALLFIGFGVQF